MKTPHKLTPAGKQLIISVLPSPGERRSLLQKQKHKDFEDRFDRNLRTPYHTPSAVTTEEVYPNGIIVNDSRCIHGKVKSVGNMVKDVNLRPGTEVFVKPFVEPVHVEFLGDKYLVVQEEDILVVAE